MMLDLFTLRKLVNGYGKKSERGKKKMVKSINVRTVQVHEIQIDSVGNNQKVILDKPAAPVKRMRSIVRTIFNGLVGCLITSGWSVTVSED
jgi:hypothetical protein